MNVHRINISSLPSDQSLHIDVSVMFPDVNLRLFPITLFLRSATSVCLSVCKSVL